MTKPAALARQSRHCGRRQRPTAVRAREERSSTKVGAGAAVAMETAATTGSNPRHQRKGLIGPPTPMPVWTGRETEEPSGR
eukprot:8887774-Alexandrium_andersonii.AAC.1